MSVKLLILTQVVDRHDPALGFFHRWVQEFASSSESVEVVCLQRGEYDLPKNVSVHTLGKERGLSRLSYVWNFYRTIWGLRRKYDSVFVHMNSEYLILGGIVWRVLGKRTLLWHTHKSMTLMHRISEKLVNVIATASPESYRLKSKKLHVLGHGIDTDIFCPGEISRDGVFRIISTGRISRVKGLHTLLSAVKMLARRGVVPEVLIIGGPVTPDDAQYQKELIAEADRLALSSVVHFVGSVSHRDIISYLQHADVFVNCSDTGSLDKAVLEAMSVGLSVVTSNEGLRTTLQGYSEELMFPPGDAESLSQKLLGIKEHSQEEREKLSRDLRRIVVEGHSLEKLIPRILKLIQ